MHASRAGSGSSPLSKQTIVTIAVAVGGGVIILALLGLLAVAWCALDSPRAAYLQVEYAACMLAPAFSDARTRSFQC
jgi:hypothetical protein